MSIFGSIMSKVFGTDAHAAPSGGAATGSSTASTTATSKGDATGSIATSGKPGSVDVEAVLTGLAQKSGRPSNWRVSIVDLMSLLGLESSLATRQALAKELGYTGSLTDTAPMNIWLHKQVMTKLAENGGKVPDDLKHHA